MGNGINIWIFGVPGILITAFGLRPGLTSEEKQYISMKLVPKRLISGITISVVSVVILYLFYEVVNVAPTVVMLGALFGSVYGSVFMVRKLQRL